MGNFESNYQAGQMLHREYEATYSAHQQGWTGKPSSKLPSLRTLSFWGITSGIGILLALFI